MKLITDLHVHSKYSRATSKELSPEGLISAARVKGIHVIGTGDFTHPKYLAELKEKLTPSDWEGFFVLKENARRDDFPVFMLTQEISCIYTDRGRGRRNHILIAAPDFETVDRIASRLSKIGNLASDGRPILGMSSEELAKTVFDANTECLVIPAHIWTPWFSMFGSKSGYYSVKECFGEMSRYIFAVETGLSSDPLMNWRVPELDSYAIVSHGDAHSGGKVGREGTVYELERAGYQNIKEALKNSARLDKENLPKNYIAYTIEFYPEEGKYHYDGHRACDVVFSPEQTKRAGGLCPKCRKPLTLGVVYRVETLAGRTEEQAREYGERHRPPFTKIVPLSEIIANAFGVKSQTRKTREQYDLLIREFKSEYAALMDVSIDDLARAALPEIAEGVRRVREGLINVSPGYDGLYGTVSVFNSRDRVNSHGSQAAMF
ncbi:MAG: DNA helicase UvrD [Candidatus Jacksonbacteria bacterium]|nr:DNA helicase UvrD [Candidatus Jacksonbacteria bacterium]